MFDKKTMAQKMAKRSERAKEQIVEKKLKDVIYSIRSSIEYSSDQGHFNTIYRKYGDEYFSENEHKRIMEYLIKNGFKVEFNYVNESAIAYEEYIYKIAWNDELKES